MYRYNTIQVQYERVIVSCYRSRIQLHGSDAWRPSRYTSTFAFVTEDATFEAITIDILRNDKQFVKLIKKQQKDLDAVNKHHIKEKSLLQKQHCMVVDKMVAAHEKERMTHEKLVVERQAERNLKPRRRSLGDICLFILTVS